MCEKTQFGPLDFFTREEKIEMLKEYAHELELEKRHLKELLKKIEENN